MPLVAALAAAAETETPAVGDHRVMVVPVAMAGVLMAADYMCRRGV
jgi:hypothetical protein